jgi:exonuclease III
MAGLLLQLLLLPIFVHGLEELNITAISWNVNSVAKIKNDPRAISHLVDCDVAFLQETLLTRMEDCLVLPGYVGHHNLAIPTNRRPSRGVSSYFRIESFVDGSISQVLP